MLASVKLQKAAPRQPKAASVNNGAFDGGGKKLATVKSKVRLMEGGEPADGATAGIEEEEEAAEGADDTTEAKKGSVKSKAMMALLMQI